MSDQPRPSAAPVEAYFDRTPQPFGRSSTLSTTTLLKAIRWGHAQLSGNRQQILLPSDAGGRAALQRFHRHGERARAAPSLCAAHGNGQFALLGSGNGCRWFPLRPRDDFARVNGEYTEHAGFLDAMAQDPALSAVKLIAEPWDTGTGGYQVGNFPPGWAEWNDQYRDTVRRFWKGNEDHLPAFASRFSGSADIHGLRGRRPWASINFVTAHDGFTLRDLVSYNEKHNEANKEDNRDGSDNNTSWNCGTEGPTDDPEIAGLRKRQMRNFLATRSCRRGCPCYSAATSSAEARAATATPTARTTKSPGSTGRAWATKARRCSFSPASLSCFGAPTLSSTATGSSLARSSPALRSKTSSGCARTAQRCQRRTGETRKQRRSRCGSAASPGSCT